MNKISISIASLGACVSLCHGATIVSNTDGGFGFGPDDGTGALPRGDVSSSFTTGSGIYELNSVSFTFAEAFGGGTPGQFSVSLHSDAAAIPGALIANLIGSGDPGFGVGVYTFVAPIVTSANTTYWLTFHDSGNNGNEAISAAGTDETSTAGWTIGNSIYSSFDAGSVNNTPFQMSIDATPVPEASSSLLLSLAALSVVSLRRRKS